MFGFNYVSPKLRYIKRDCNLCYKKINRKENRIVCICWFTADIEKQHTWGITRH